MIKETEVRVGNWFLVNPDVLNEGEGALYVTVTKWDYTNTNFKNFLPIPITPEILKKCGFKVEFCSSYATGEKVDYKVFRNRKFTYNEIQNAWWYGHILDHQPKYLHQLQNLYFALTGEELEINL